MPATAAAMSGTSTATSPPPARAASSTTCRTKSAQTPLRKNRHREVIDRSSYQAAYKSSDLAKSPDGSAARMAETDSSESLMPGSTSPQPQTHRPPHDETSGQGRAGTRGRVDGHRLEWLVAAERGSARVVHVCCVLIEPLITARPRRRRLWAKGPYRVEGCLQETPRQ